jgi:multidrug resistance efflux pump
VDSESIRQQQLQVQLQSLNIQQAEKDLKDYQIVSPFDGVIDNIDFQLHEYVDSSKRVTLSNKFLYRIEVEVDQIDVVSIEV